MSAPTPETQDAIVEAAVEVFSRQGVDRTSVEDLLTAANVSRRTFYKYFDSKEAVLAALYEAMTTSLVELVEGAPEATSLEHVMLGIDAYLDFHLANQRLLQILVEEAMRSESPLHARRAWLREKLVAALQRTAKQVSGKKVEGLLLYGILSMLEGLSLHLFETGAKPADIERAKATLRHLAETLMGRSP